MSLRFTKVFESFSFSLCIALYSLNLTTVKPRFNEPLFNEVLGITNDIFHPSDSVMYRKEPRYNDPISPVPWHLGKSRFHCNEMCGETRQEIGF